MASKNNTSEYINNYGVMNYEDIINALTFQDVFEYYGVETNGSSKISCPLPKHGGNDSSPSFSIKNEHFFKCFGCGAFGSPTDLIRYLGEVNGLEAIKIGGMICGIEAIPSKNSEGLFTLSAIQELNEELNYHEFHRYSRYHIIEGHTPENENDKKIYEGVKEYRNFAKIRRLDLDLLNQYLVGYANKDGYEPFIIERGKKSGLASETDGIINVDKLVEAGLLKIDGGDAVATIKNNIVFPIIVDGKIEGFIGRNADLENKNFKHNKYACKFGLWNSDAVQNYSTIHVYEGCIDAMTSIQCGFPNSVALFGVNALGEREKAVLLKADEIILHFDDDKTGNDKKYSVAEKLGYKCRIAKPIDTNGYSKDLNELFISTMNNYLSEMSEEMAFEKAKKDVHEEIMRMSFGNKVPVKKVNKVIIENDDGTTTEKEEIVIVKDEYGDIVFEEDEDDEFVRVDGAKNLIEEKLEEWTKNGCKPEQFQDLMKVVYQQYSGQAVLIGSFRKLITENKGYGISAKDFDATVKEVKGEVALAVKSSSNIQNFEGVEARYEVHDNILYKMTPVIVNGEVVDRMNEITTTVPIIKGILYDKADGKEKVEVQFTKSNGQIEKVIVPKESILKKNSIIDALGSKGLDVTDVTSQDIILWLRQYSKENFIPRKEVVKRTGLYKVDGKYYIIGQRGEVISENGLIDDFSLVYQSDLMDRNIKEITEINYDEWIESVKAISMIEKLNERANAQALINHVLVSVFREFFYENRGAFNIFQITGLKGSGKTTMVKPLMTMVCGHNKPLNCKTNRFPLSANLSMSNAFLLVMDEYKASDLSYHNGDLMYLMKCSYDSSKDEKGKATQDLNRYFYHRPALIIGENVFYGEDSDAVKERAGIITFTNNWLKENRRITKPIVNELMKMDLSKFTGGYLQFVLKILNSGKADEILKIAEKKAYEFSEKYDNLLTDRHIGTATTQAFGFEIRKLLDQEANIESDITDEDYEAVFKKVLNHAINQEFMETSLDRTMQFIANTNLRREFTEDEMFFDADEHTLYIVQEKLLSLLESYRFQHKSEIPEKSGLKQYLNDSLKDENGYIKAMSKPKTKNSKTYRYLCIDTKKLSETAHIDEAMWFGTGIIEQEIFMVGDRVYNSEKSRNMVIASELAERVVNGLKRELKGNITNENGIKAEIKGIVIDRLEGGKELLRDEFTKEMVTRYLERFKNDKIEETNVIEIFKEGKIS